MTSALAPYRIGGQLKGPAVLAGGDVAKDPVVSGPRPVRMTGGAP
jgi:hypothetical protein